MNEYPSLRPCRLEAAAHFLPGGVRTMMHLAWLSGDSRVRAVAVAWHSLTAVARVDARIEDLCSAGGISEAHFIGGVVGTAWELGMDW